MAERTQYFEPRYPLIFYGDGHIAQLISKQERESEEGILGYELIINPSRETIEEYNLTHGEDLDEWGYCRRWYPASVIKILRDDPTTGRVLIKTNFEGEDTALSREMRALYEHIEDQQKYIKILKAGKARLYHDLKILTAQYKEYFAQQADLLETIKRPLPAEGPVEEPTEEMR